MVVHDQTSQTGIERRDGFIEWMKANAPGHRAAAACSTAAATRPSRPTSPSRSSPPTPTSRASTAPTRARRSASSRASRRAARRASRSSASTPARPRSTRSTSGVMAGAITQNPVGMGKETVDAAVKAINGETAAEGHRHRLLLVRQDQHRRPEDQGRPLRVARGRRAREVQRLLAEQPLRVELAAVQLVADGLLPPSRRRSMMRRSSVPAGRLTDGADVSSRPTRSRIVRAMPAMTAARSGERPEPARVIETAPEQARDRALVLAAAA